MEAGNLETGKGAQIRHTFFEKKMTSPLVFHARSAYNWRAKIVTLGEEVKRRLMNSDRQHTEEERAAILRTFLVKMANSGYGPPTRKEVLKSGIRKYFRKLFTEQTGGPRLYRTDQEMKEGRRFKFMLTKTWYKPKRGGRVAREKKESP